MSFKDIRRHSRLSRSPSYTQPNSDNSSAIHSTPLRYLGIPFSWEQFPGIPKKNTKMSQSSQNLLPLPPSNHSPTIKKYRSSQDPFFAAFLECSKDKEFHLTKTTPPAGRPGFVVSMYSSCKKTCAVSESIVYRRRQPAPADYF